MAVEQANTHLIRHGRAPAAEHLIRTRTWYIVSSYDKQQQGITRRQAIGLTASEYANSASTEVQYLNVIEKQTKRVFNPAVRGEGRGNYQPANMRAMPPIRQFYDGSLNLGLVCKTSRRTLENCNHHRVHLSSSYGGLGALGKSMFTDSLIELNVLQHQLGYMDRRGCKVRSLETPQGAGH